MITRHTQREHNSIKLENSVNSILSKRRSESRNIDTDDQESLELANPHQITQIEITATTKHKSRTWWRIRMNSKKVTSPSPKKKKSGIDKIQTTITNNEGSNISKITYKLSIPNPLVISVEPPKFQSEQEISLMSRKLSKKVNKFTGFRRALKRAHDIKARKYIVPSKIPLLGKKGKAKEADFQPTYPYFKSKVSQNESGRIFINPKPILPIQVVEPMWSNKVMQKMKEQEARAKSAQRQFRPNFSIHMS